ncbi:hypothetical protein JWH11_00975 [Xanthomonas melonis]|uniref:Uncharacterized protein n=1 Tax=Xanthomonas melonis TaxID=56456 RepID=A0ABS8NPR0_9XANT|nr:hypothetical protein [Xanthomonas melonis]MCD0244416.1 hypothetical protein [Xanthomonas melonis]MCD0256763.1 hypothetical protein [Xanthomonas melonis]MCD0265034.1 hypothetical protein [Xanthomonas melonis]
MDAVWGFFRGDYFLWLISPAWGDIHHKKRHIEGVLRVSIDQVMPLQGNYKKILWTPVTLREWIVISMPALGSIMWHGWGRSSWWHVVVALVLTRLLILFNELIDTQKR